ncbi:Protein of unknown function [Aliiroseovarius halocynthiae]|uniref:DUF3833 domain-containing protein n=1 Tax=Aliiroseovarius halocynthiae TaxID=985055 RepID=A0A545SW99_9RHOB|nr:DUF3833 domain-containing protein [Aliiroseovarius halocynthiae]TQV69241.1 DUF3833 domain-containing protein [Aliiroseovarius halocynthiae]SMR72009.1 Protein of unknown function [Aliiroseovarius halocynthiae]
MKLLSTVLILIIVALIYKSYFLSFRAQSPIDYADTGPKISLKEHLSGTILSEGLIYGPNGRVTNSFVARMEGQWTGDTGTLSEEFTYSNGRQQSRKWFLTQTSDTTFIATADDIVGQATGTVSGSTIQMHYRIVLPDEAGGHQLDVTDWLYLTESGVILNRSELRKFGLKAAELVATMRPQEVN